MATLLWLTSRSTYETGTQFCPYKRWLQNHAGAGGYGFSRKALSMPLATGSYIHEGLANILTWVRDSRLKSGRQPDVVPDEVIRWGIELAVEKYHKVVAKRGILTLAMDTPEDLAALQRLMHEQEFLIAGLIWQWCLGRLTTYLEEYLVVDVEVEEVYVLDCTCGLGDGRGDIHDHETRDCTGIGLMSKPDVLGERKSDHLYGYTEFKTASRRSNPGSWERKPQFLMGVVGVERRLGVDVSHAWVEELIKGQRKRPYPYDDLSKPKQQQSPLCYPYFSPAIPPGRAAEWRPAFNFFDAQGMKGTALKTAGYKQTALWDVPREEAFPGIPVEMSVPEYWSKVLINEYPDHAAKTWRTIGPLPKQKAMIEKALRGVITEERLWQERVWKLYNFSVETGKTYGDDEYMAFVETVVPRSWNCDPFGPEHPCAYQPWCHPVTDDWRDPVGTDLAVARVPHHEPEKQQVIARGLKPEDAEGWEDEEDLTDDAE